MLRKNRSSPRGAVPGAPKDKVVAPASLKEKAAAVTALLAAVAVVYYTAHLPVAIAIAPAEQILSLRASGDILLLRPLVAAGGAPPTPLLTVLGAANEVVDVHVNDGVLAAATVADLRLIRSRELAATRGAINWVTVRKGNGRSRIDVGLRPIAGRNDAPEVEFRHATAGDAAILAVTARHAVAIVRLSTLLGDDRTAGERNALRVGAAPVLNLPGALPIQVEVGDGGTMSLVFPVGTPKTGLYLGEGAAGVLPGADTGIRVRDVGLDPTAAADYKWYACAASRGELLPWPRAPRTSDCAATSPLVVSDMRLTPEQLTLMVRGDAFVVREGAVHAVGWLTQLEQNKVLAALMGVCVTALVNWVWQVYVVRRRRTGAVV